MKSPKQMTIEATDKAKMPEGTSAVLDNRTLQKDYSTLIPILKKDLRVLDIGCGTGAISKGIAEIVGKNGYVIGIDSSEHLIAKGKKDWKSVANLELIAVDLFEYEPEEKFDLVVSARVLQWLSNPEEALIKCKEFLKPGGQMSVLDYNHTKLKWMPEPPESMKRFYKAFLNWRAEAGMDNEIAEHLPEFFKKAGFHSIEILNSNEVYQKGEDNFIDKAGIWLHVASLRGRQVVQNGYLSDEELSQTIKEYDTWVKNEAKSMTMKLNEIRGKM
jgi:ubiquinone/menaquinone biosynthesis C-methylase UbiE